MKSYEVSDQLMHYIIDHKLKEGDKLPNEYELADIFQVSIYIAFNKPNKVDQ